MSFSRVAAIKNKKVENVIILSLENYDETLEMLKKDMPDVELVNADDFEHETFSNVSAGWDYIDGKFIAPVSDIKPTDEEIAAAIAMLQKDKEEGNFVGQNPPEIPGGTN
jgi:hypothetical protein